MCSSPYNLLLMRANLALRRMTGPGLRAPSYHWTKSDFKKEENILFLWTVFLLPGPPCILLSILKLQNVFIRIILIRHCLQGICSAEIILLRFISITAVRNILLWSGCCSYSSSKKYFNSIDKVVILIQLQLQTD